MDKTQLKEGMMAIINTGSLKGAMGKIKRVDKKRKQVIIEIDYGFDAGWKTYRMSWDDIDTYEIKFNNIG